MSKKQKLPEKLCLIPFMSLNIHPTGSYQLCSSARKEFPLNPDSSSLSSIYNSDNMNKVRQQMLNNQKVIPDCTGCYQLEDQNVDSKRTRFNKKRLDFYGESFCHDAVYGSKKKIYELDLSFSNLCNLNCVMCNSLYSSSWFKPDQKAASEGLNFRETKNEKLWKISKSLLDSIIEDHSQDLKEIFIKGGEPFIDPQCIYFLNKLSNYKNKNKDLIVYIQTNGTVFNSKIIEAIGDLNVEISFSIDGLDDHYEWIRGFSFDKIMKNFNHLHKLKNLKHSYIQYTTSAFNFHRIPEMIEFVIKQKKDFPLFKNLAFSVAHEKFLNFRVFHQKARMEIIQYIQKTVASHNISDSFFDGYQPLLKELSMEKLNEKSVTQFKSWLKFCNSMRNQKIQNIDEKYNKLLQEAL